MLGGQLGEATDALVLGGGNQPARILPCRRRNPLLVGRHSNRLRNSGFGAGLGVGKFAIGYRRRAGAIRFDLRCCDDSFRVGAGELCISTARRRSRGESPSLPEVRLYPQRPERASVSGVRRADLIAPEIASPTAKAMGHPAAAPRMWRADLNAWPLDPSAPWPLSRPPVIRVVDSIE